MFFPQQQMEWSGAEGSFNLRLTDAVGDSHPTPLERKLVPLGDDVSHVMFLRIGQKNHQKTGWNWFCCMQAPKSAGCFWSDGNFPFLLLSGEKKRCQKEVVLFGWGKG